MQHRQYNPLLYGSLEERRQATRFPKEPDVDSAVVWQESGDELLVTVHDESLGGICLVMHDVENFAIGAAAIIVYHSEIMEATVRNSRRQPDNTFLVGFECHPWHERDKSDETGTRRAREEEPGCSRSNRAQGTIGAWPA